jgi:hypothetical protein
MSRWQLVVKLSSGNTSASSYWTINSSFFFARLRRPACVHSPAASLLPNRITPSPVMQPCPWPPDMRSFLSALASYACGHATPMAPCTAAERRSSTWRRVRHHHHPARTCAPHVLVSPRPYFLVYGHHFRNPPGTEEASGWVACGMVAAARTAGAALRFLPLPPIVASTGKICGQDRWSTNKFHQERTW